MSLEHTLNNLRQLIGETIPNLELFVDNNVQPSSTDCENLQKQLNALQEKLSVFKYLKTNKEISPSFGIHSRINEATSKSKEIITEDTSPVETKTNIIINETVSETKIIDSPINTNTNPSNKQLLEITLNQKFQFINDLFAQNNSEYLMAIDQINNCVSWEDAELYIQSLKSIYNWKDANENYKRLVDLSKKRFT